MFKKAKALNSCISSKKFISIRVLLISISKKSIILSLIAFSIIWVPLCYAAPSISSVSGVFSEAGTGIAIEGLGFGTDPSPESLKGNIEAGTPGSDFSAANWSQFYTTKAIYSADEAHSGSKSILFHLTENSTALMYNHGSTFTELYFTAWIKLIKNDTQTRFQWKPWRVKNTNDYTIAASGHSGIIGDCWWGAIGANLWGNNDIQVYCDGVNLSETDSLETDAFLFDEWQRIEAYYKKSDTDTENGQFEWRRVGRGSGEVIASNYTAMTHNTACADQLWQYLLLGHYYGNVSGGDGRDMEVYYDDVYLSTSKARVEIGDNVTWPNCTHREIQIPTAWSNSSIVATVNQGSFNNGDSAYLFVVDGDGNVSNGYPITIAGSAPPSPPAGLKVVD